jgi:hypothetical protein
VTANERTLINHALLNGEKFVFVDRLDTTFNTDTFAYVGVPKFMSPGLVYKFDTGVVYAQFDNDTWGYRDSAGWMPCKEDYYLSAKTWEEIYNVVTA